MRSLLGVLSCLAVRFTVGLGIAAVLIGRYAPEPRSAPLVRLRSPASPRYHEVGGYWFPDCRYAPRLLDRKTGVVLPLPLSDAESLDFLVCSPWQDSRGQFHLVGRWQGRSDPGGGALPLGFGLAWCTFPEGRIHDRVALDPIPLGNPCWYPDASGRVLYASGDGRLYHLAFPGQDDRSRGPVPSAQPRPIRWQTGPPGRDPNRIQDLHWPNVPPNEGRILVSLSYQHQDTASLDAGLHLWWLDLGGDGTEIVAAGRLMSPDETDVPSGRAEERLPTVVTTHEGTAMLAYLAREDGRTTWDLWVTPIASCRVDGVPKALTSAGRKLSEGCNLVAPAFSADGRWVYVVRHSAGPGAHLERLLVAAAQDLPDARGGE